MTEAACGIRDHEAESLADEVAGQYLTFHLGNETFAAPILKAQEIVGITEVTHVPRTPPFVRGVINLRGKVIPLVDLRLKFNLEAKEDTERTCIVVVQVAGSSGAVTMGVIVDEVSEVMDISADQIEPPPSFGAIVDTSFMLGMAKVDGVVVTLLSIDKVLSADEVASLGEAMR